jgi:hypothetical protein
MNTHFCKVGKIKANTDKAISIKDLEKRIANFVDDISKVEFTKDINSAI